MTIHRVCLGLLLLSVSAPAGASEPNAARTDRLQRQADVMWNMAWGRFFRDKTNLFYDYLSSYEPGAELRHLPTADEVRRLYPSLGGQGSGMEDSMILAGVMLSGLVDMYTVTRAEHLRDDARKVFQGIELCATAHGSPGFLARSVCLEDGKSTFVSTSRDQYTHAIHGMWKYYHSGLCDEKTKAELRKVLADIGDRMIRNVTPENDYDYLCSDGRKCPLGISRMWNVKEHEAARLPMFYAAAWDVTGERKYYDMYRRYMVEAVEQSVRVPPTNPAWTELQMQCSLELLLSLEKDPDLARKIRQAMDTVAGYGAKKMTRCGARILKHDLDMAMLGPDWRKAKKWDVRHGTYRFPRWGEYQQVWYLSREFGEAAIMFLIARKDSVTPEQRKLLEDVLLAMDYEHTSSCAIVYHLACYWQLRRAALENRP
jgi:hypothetical protein